MEGGGGGGVMELGGLGIEDRGRRTVICCQWVSVQSVTAALIKDTLLQDI